MNDLSIRKTTRRVYNNETYRYNQVVCYAVVDADGYVIKWFRRLSEAKTYIKEVHT